MKSKPEVKRFRPYGKFTGPIIPNVLLRYRNLPASCKLMWGRLAQYLGKSGDAFPSYDTLAEEIGVSRRQAITIIQRLEEDDFLELEHRAGHTCIFHFLKHPCLGGEEVAPLENVEGVKDLHQGGEENNTPGVKKLHQRGEVEFTLRESLKRIKEENHHHQEPDPIPDTLENGGGVSFFSGNGKKPSPLTPEQQAYIELSVAYQEKHGGFTKGKAAFKRWLTKELVGGRRDMSDFEDMQKWKDKQSSSGSALYDRAIREEWGPKYRRLDAEEQDPPPAKPWLPDVSKAYENDLHEQRQEAEETERRHAEYRAKVDECIATISSLWELDRPIEPDPEALINWIVDFLETPGNKDSATLQALTELWPNKLSTAQGRVNKRIIRAGKKKLGIPVTPDATTVQAIIMVMQNGGEETLAKLRRNHPDEYEAALKIVAADQPDEMTF